MTRLGRAWAITLARAVNTAFFFSTSVYCLLKYSPFTYEQFIKPNVSVALGAFAVWHGDLHWLMLSITALTLAPFLERSLRGGSDGRISASVALSVWLFTHPIWLQAGTSRANLILAVVAALPPIWLAVFDHVATDARPTSASAAPSAVFAVSSGARTWRSCWIAAMFAFAVYAAAAPVRLGLTGGIALPFGGLLLGWAVSGIAHVTAFTLVFLVLTLVSGLADWTEERGRTEYWLLYAVSASIALAESRHAGAYRDPRPAAWMVPVATTPSRRRGRAARHNCIRTGAALFGSRRMAGADCRHALAAHGAGLALDRGCSPAHRPHRDVSTGSHV